MLELVFFLFYSESSRERERKGIGKSICSREPSLGITFSFKNEKENDNKNDQDSIRQ